MTTPRHIEYVPVDDVVPAERNPKDHDLRSITRSMRVHGFTQPAIVDERTGRLVAGHGRLEALRQLRDDREDPPAGIRVDDGTWLAPVVRGWASADDAHAEALVVADNQLTIAGGWDNQVLGDQLRAIAAADPSLTTSLGFDPDELADLLNQVGEETPAGDNAEDELVVPDDPITVLGQSWQLGRHRITCGDCTDPAAWEALFADTDRARMVWTDPPYGVNYVGKTKRKLPVYNDAPDGAIPLFADALDTIAPHLVDGAAVYVAHATGEVGMGFAQVLDAAPYRLLQQLFWVKDAFTLGRSDYHYRQEGVYYAVHGTAAPMWRGPDDASTVFEVPRPNANKHHPTMKPLALVRPMLRNSSDPGEVVVEPFSGSGATLMACQAESRICRSMELSPEYVDVACARYQAATGEKPVDIATGEPVDFGELADQMSGYRDTAAA